MADLIDLTKAVAFQRGIVTANRTKRFAGLVLGKKGSGKTSLLNTVRFPALVDQLDPDGLLTVQDQIEAGNIWPRYYSTFADWLEGHLALRRGIALFKNGEEKLELPVSLFATYSLDSFSTWADMHVESIINNTKGKPRGEGTGTHGDAMEKRDWGTFLQKTCEYIRFILALPLDILCFGHVKKDEDELGQTIYNMQISGQSDYKLPQYFCECYYLDSKKGDADKAFLCADGINRFLVTRNEGLIPNTTRLGRPGLDGKMRFANHEKPDIKYLLGKAGFSTDDLPRIGG